MSIERDNDSQNTSSSLKENRCYICKRTEAEVQEFLIPNLDETTKRYNSEMATLESLLQNKKNSIKSYLDNILKSTEKANLDFKINTAVNDVDSFKKIIPNVDQLLGLGKNFAFPMYVSGTPGVTEYTLSDIRRKLVELRKEMNDNNFQFKNWKGKEWAGHDEYHIHKYFEWSDKKNELEICNDEIKEISKNLEKLRQERDTHLASVKYQNKVIKEIKHRKIIREIKSSIEYPEYEIKLKDGCTTYRSRDKDSYETQFSFDVCAICNTLVWHRTDYAIDSEFHDQSPPPLELGEEIISLAPDRDRRRL